MFLKCILDLYKTGWSLPYCYYRLIPSMCFKRWSAVITRGILFIICPVLL